MAQNSLYPGFVKIKYSSNSHTHYQVLPVLPVSFGVGTEPTFETATGAPVAMNAAIDAYIAIVDNLFTDTSSFVIAEFWHYPSPESDPMFYYVYEIGAPGAGVGTVSAYSQLVVSLRTALGGYLKLYFMEVVQGIVAKDDYPFSNVTVAALTAYLTDGDTGWVVGRDGGFPISGLRALTKVNDALRKKYVLNT